MKRKYYFFWSLLLGLIGVTASAQITSTSAINNTKTFTIKSVNRGFIYYDGANSTDYLYSSSHTAITNATPTGTTNEQFALLRGESTPAGYYYLYSIGASKFVTAETTTTGLRLTDAPSTTGRITLTKNGSYFIIKYPGVGNKIVNITNWSAKNGIRCVPDAAADDGNKMTIKAVNTAADLSDALSKILLLENPSITIESLLTSAAEHLALAGKPGYPSTTSAAYISLKEKAEAESPNAYKLYTAINAFKTETDVAMPQDGKAYTFTFKHMNGTRTYLYWNGSKVTSAVLGNEGLPETAKFICRKVTVSGGTRYMFVNNAGKYLVWWGGSGDGAYENNNGFTSAYDSGKNLFQIIKFTNSGNTNVECTNEELFGCVGLKGTRNGADAPFFILKNTAGGAVASSAAYVDKTTTNSGYRTCAVMIEEATYPNNVTFKATDIDNGAGGTYALATFSAPFATVIPEGVTAYNAIQDPENSDIIIMSEVSGVSALPAGAGFILSGTANATVTMVPATDEGQASTSGTLLLGSAGRTVALSSTNDYVLGKKEEHVAFYRVNSEANVLPMNRAYLHFEGGGVVKMNFNHTTTGIEAVSPAAQQDGPIYDLSGRRVSHMSKGGIYIRNGKKILVK